MKWIRLGFANLQDEHQYGLRTDYVSVSVCDISVNICKSYSDMFPAIVHVITDIETNP